MRAIWIVPVITSILILGTFTLVNSFSVPDSQKSTNQILEEYGKIPLSFEQNLGQTDSQVKFLSRGSGYTIFFTPDDVVMSLRSTSEDSSNQYITIEMSLIGVNPAQITGLEKQAGISNYFIGNDPQKWYTDIPNYANIKYTDVYSGIDLVYYGNQQKLEYDFVVAPGADPQNILFEINGADKLILDEKGNLIIETTDGQLIQHAPIIYQEINGKRQVIDGGYKLEENRIGFDISDYDNTLPLVIDPVLVYSTYLGGSNNDGGRAIAVDSSDNAYVTGNTRSTNFPTKNPIQAAHAGGVFDAFVTKINAAGNAHVYSTYLGGSSDDSGRGIAVDSSENAYVTGQTFSTNFPTKNPIQAANAGGIRDAFVTKINAAGNALVYSTYLGGSGFDSGRDIAVDSSDNAYVTGNTRSTNFPTKNPIQAAHAGGVFDAFVTKINAAGNAHVYSTYLGGSGGDFGFSIAVDSSRNAYVTGETQSTNFPTKNPIQAAHAGGGDTFVTKINAAGNAHAYSTYLGGSSDDSGRGIAVDSSGNAYVTGPTGSTNFPTKNPIQAANAGSGDVYVTKINAAGNAHAYSTYLGGSGLEIGSNIAVDSSRNAYVTGETQSTDFPTTNPIQAAHAGGVFDAFVTKINAAGNAHAYSTYLGGSNNDGGRDIAVDLSGNAYVIGETLSTNFPTTNPIQAALAGDTDSFVLKIREVDTVPPVITLNGDPTVTLKVGIDTYTELGATVTDDDPAYTGTVTIGGDTVDPNTVGTYIVTYNAPADPSGNPAAQVTRTINVVDTTDTDGDGVTDSDEVNVYGTDPLDVDTDGDSLEDGWEIFGIDANSDGTIDLDLSSLGADPLHKDIFVEVDFMQLHQPNADAMNDLVTAFAISPVSNPDGLNGINLHIQVDNAMAHINCITVWSGFDSLKSALFGTSSQRADPNASNILAAKRLVYHYGLFVHGQCNTGYSGIGERPGDDFIISRGNSAAGHNSLINGRTQDAGIFMHEIGHNFGLRHGGGDIVNCKPNYLSTMKYNRMYPVYIPDRPLDYSREKIDDLVESNLDESKGVPSTSGLKTMYGPHIFPDISYKISLTGIAIDWNRDGDSEDSGVMADINLFVGIPDCSVAGLQTLTGFNDWSNLVYNFRTTSNFAPAEHQDPLDTPELTNEEIKAMQTMHVESLDQAIQNLSDESFTKPKVADARKKAFHNKLQAVTAMILADEFQDAIDKLTHDIRTKMDGSVGGNPKNDWIDPEAQAELIEILDNFVATLEKWLE